MNADYFENLAQELAEEFPVISDDSMLEYCIVETARSDGRDLGIIFIGELDECEAHISERDETLPFCEGRYHVSLY